MTPFSSNESKLLAFEILKKADFSCYDKILPRLDEGGVFDAVSIEDAHRHNSDALFRSFHRLKVVLGVVKIASSEVETVAAILDRVRHVKALVPASRLVLAPDCGLGFLPDTILEQKLANLTLAAKTIE
jgi:5-methyltetrahydropteroyltriglutamate--homocysteine methyltransferase